MLAKRFTNDPLQSIPVDGARRRLSGNGEPEPGVGQIVSARRKHEARAYDSTSVGEDHPKLAGLQKPGAPRKARTMHNRNQELSRARPLARLACRTLRPPRVDILSRKP